ncbi:bifunctional MaoC family dehydratase N-terminal/OB-fold nucleic acid binding domain-containing protein [Streptomyces diacarni]|uniref:bifunctional MaoC family dehydratase N-terminal/OB-fold nucleic acid binding domain-containing protein n=1 Tax=Streptomyces diacarni TaxID=2800381 RepID=UPI0011C0517C|nr:OB-fold domain-containing protein [Streptomyces diacarni]
MSGTDGPTSGPTSRAVSEPTPGPTSGGASGAAPGPGSAAEARHAAPGDPDALYDLLRGYEGRPAGASVRGRDPVNTPMIRHWCEALGHPVPPDGSAPATMLQVWTMAGLAGREGRTGAYDALLGALDDAGFTSVVATDCEQEYAQPLRPGDEVTCDALIESVSGRKTTKLGTGYFVTTRMDVRVDGVTAGTHRFRILKYRPATSPSGTPRAVRAPSERSPAGPSERPPSQRSPSETPRRPRPVVNRDSAGFWEGVAAHKLLFQRCDACAAPRFPWLPGCNACGSPRWSAAESAGLGTVYSYVVMHHPPFPAFDPPYAVVLVELAEGFRIVSNLVGVPCDEVRIGMPVELEFLRVDDALELPVFRSAPKQAAA